MRVSFFFVIVTAFNTLNYSTVNISMVEPLRMKWIATDSNTHIHPSASRWGREEEINSSSTEWRLRWKKSSINVKAWFPIGTEHCIQTDIQSFMHTGQGVSCPMIHKSVEIWWRYRGQSTPLPGNKIISNQQKKTIDSFFCWFIRNVNL